MSGTPWSDTPCPLARAEFDDVATTALHERRSAPQMLLEAARRHARRPAFTSMGRTLSYGDMDERSGALAAYLRHDLGLARGAR
ncbi:MAG TPA: hypothetical protein VFO79_15805, partial [Xanthomonadales bacterium]|nr:hypothetical protein [Xanthomonadales bacterium]